MFKARLTEAGFFRNLVSSLAVILDETVLNLSPQEISLRSSDPSRVAMVHCALPHSSFEEYACDRDAKICISLSEVLKFLKGVKGDETLEISVGRSDLISLRVVGEYERVFNLSTLAVKEEEELPLPSLTPDAKIRITTSCLKRMLEDVAAISDYVRIKASGNSLVFDGTGDFGNVVLTLNKGSESLLNFEVAKESLAAYGADFLSQIIKLASNCSDVVTLEFSTKTPVKLDFELLQQGQLVYYLAPTVVE